MTVRVRVRQVAADHRLFNLEMCRDIDKVSAHSRWPLTTGVAQGRYYCICNYAYTIYVHSKVICIVHCIIIMRFDFGVVCSLLE